MKSVGKAANDMVKECLEQFPKIMGPEAMVPDYEKCIRISTEASLREMIAPGALVILSPIIAGLVLGKKTCAGLLSGALVSSVQLAISMSNSGGAWDNSKKIHLRWWVGKRLCERLRSTQKFCDWRHGRGSLERHIWPSTEYRDEADGYHKLGIWYSNQKCVKQLWWPFMD